MRRPIIQKSLQEIVVLSEGSQIEIELRNDTDYPILIDRRARALLETGEEVLEITNLSNYDRFRPNKYLLERGLVGRIFLPSEKGEELRKKGGIKSLKFTVEFSFDVIVSDQAVVEATEEKIDELNRALRRDCRENYLDLKVPGGGLFE